MTDVEPYDVEAAEAEAEAAAERWLFEEGRWVPTSYLLRFFDDDAALQLARWAGTDNGQRPILRTRAQVFEVHRADNTLVGPRRHNRLFGWFWKADPIASDCRAGNFKRTGEGGLHLIAIGVELSRDDLDRLIGKRPARVSVTAQPRTIEAGANVNGTHAGDALGADVIPPDETKAVLPATAKPANLRDEQHAHAAAILVRLGSKLSDAIREVAPIDNTRTTDSIQRGIRATFDLMYDRRGYPSAIQK